MNNILNCYSEYSKHSIPEIRKNFLYNLVSVIILTDVKTFEANYLNKYINLTLCDTSSEVKNCGICILHEIAKTIGFDESNKHLIEIFKNILNFNNYEMIEKIFEYLPKNLEVFYSEKLQNNQNQVLIY